MAGQAPKGLGRIFDMQSHVPTQRRNDSADAAIRQLDAKVGVGAKARQIKTVTVTAAGVVVPHLLNGKLTGWRLADNNGAVSVYRGTGEDDTKYLKLHSSGADTTVDIEVW